jgi:hypothetical protein
MEMGIRSARRYRGAVSFSFRIHLSAPLPRVLFEASLVSGLAWVDPPDGDRLTPGTYHMHIEGRSTRGVEFTWEDGVFNVRLLVASSPEDLLLGLGIACTVARFVRERIHSEDGHCLAADEMGHVYDQAWIDMVVERDARFLRQAALQQEYQNMVLVGALRPFNLGPRTVRALDAAGPEASYPQRFLDAVRRVQYPPAGYDAREAEQVVLPSGEKIGVVLWKLDRGYLFPPMKFAHLHAPDGEALFLRPETIPELPGVRATWADEVRLLVDPVPMQAWPELWAHARQKDALPTKKTLN